MEQGRSQFYQQQLESRTRELERLVKSGQEELAHEYVQKLREHLRIVKDHDF